MGVAISHATFSRMRLPSMLSKKLVHMYWAYSGPDSKHAIVK